MATVLIQWGVFVARTWVQTVLDRNKGHVCTVSVDLQLSCFWGSLVVEAVCEVL